MSKSKSTYLAFTLRNDPSPPIYLNRNTSSYNNKIYRIALGH